MAVRHRVIKADPATVWQVLADGHRYADWVVGTGASRPKQGSWPRKDASIAYEIRLGPLRLANETVVRHCREGSLLELEIMAGFLGTARFSIELREWGEHCLVLVDEHPLQGAGGVLHNAGVEALIQVRHRSMLARLARCCDDAGNGRRETPAREAREAPAREASAAEGTGRA
ncbi:SRPBCC family protein [Streptomyces naphthomycinicus]|uniref:SRPBCC family protein n=1 Tax=Streptomyces naphthomycinicus TaxID=2872625 RepID=UPI001CEC82C3|nr:SRPBCC family protein [Streptomyces sp. TML10]